MPHRPSPRMIARRTEIARMGALSPEAIPHGRFSPKDAAALQKAILGTVVLPSSADYDKDRQLSNPVFQAWPALIVYCEVFADVWHCLAFAHQHGLHVVCRSGGHSTAGFSIETEAMVIDTSRIRYVAVDPVNGFARVGAGTPLGVLNSTLDSFRLHTPGGGCPDVGVAGHMMGGGYGWTSRQYGMNCDNVVEVLVMLADGRLVRANAEVNPDLLWAVCGGTGNNFGVLLEVTYQLHELWQVWGFGLSWDMKHAAKVLETLQRDYMLDAAPPELGFQLPWMTHKEQKRLIRGTFHGSRAVGLKLVEPLLKLPGATKKLEVDQTGNYYTLNEQLLNEPYPIPDLPPSALEDKISGYLGAKLDAAAWAELTATFERDTTGWATGNFEVYGGAINALPIETNAFIHRNVYANWFLDVFYNDPATHQKAEIFMAEMMNAWHPHLNGHSNQDYPRWSQTDYRWAFFGEAFNTLLWVKQKYDPDDFFYFPQSISPYPADAPPPAESPSLFTDMEIVPEPSAQQIGG